MLQLGITSNILAIIIGSLCLTNKHAGNALGAQILINLLGHRKRLERIFAVSMGGRREEPTIRANQEVELIKGVVKVIIRRIIGTSEAIRFQIFLKIEIIITRNDRANK